VVNALNGALPLVLREAFPQAEIVCGEVFPFFEWHLQGLGFQTVDWEGDWGGMRFDLIIGNPPYNQSSDSENTIAGTSGYTTFYRRFIDRALENADTVAMVVQRTGIRYAYKQKGSLYRYCMDTNRHWNFTAGWFITSTGHNDRENCSQDSILRSVYCLDEQWRYSAPIGGSYKANIEKNFWLTQKPNTVYGVVDVPSSANPEIRRGWIQGRTRQGAQLLFKGLESRVSYVAVDEPSKAGSTAALFFDTVDEAEKARLFILNNPVVQYLQGVTSEKTLGMVFRYLKRFDLGQISTGLEIPKEWALTEDQIQLVQTAIKPKEKSED